MHLVQDRDATAFEALDAPRLPERSRAVEFVGDDSTHRVAEFSPTARLRQGDTSDVIVGVDVAGLHPARTVEPERNVDVSPAKLGNLGKPRDQQIPESLEGPAVGRIRGVDDHEPADVEVPVGCFAVKKCRILAAHLAHSSSLPRLVAPR